MLNFTTNITPQQLSGKTIKFHFEMSDYGEPQFLLFKYDGGDNAEPMFTFLLDRVRVRTENDNSQFTDVLYNTPFNNLYVVCVVITFNGKIYINDEEYNIPFDPLNTEEIDCICSQVHADEFYMWDRILTRSEITALQTEFYKTSGGETPDPTESSPLYTAPLTVGTDIEVSDLIKAKAFKDGSESAVAEYTVRAPYFSGGTLAMEEIQIPLEFTSGGTLAMEEIEVIL